MNDQITKILSIIGAAAWLPVVFKPIINYFRKVQVSLLDYHLMPDAIYHDTKRNEKKEGTIFMLALNIYIYETTFFAKSIDIAVTMKNGVKFKTVIVDFSAVIGGNKDGSRSYYPINSADDLNFFKTITANADNMKFIAFITEHGNLSNLDEVKEIEFVFNKSEHIKKKVRIENSEFPKFSPGIIKKLEKRINEKQ